MLGRGVGSWVCSMSYGADLVQQEPSIVVPPTSSVVHTKNRITGSCPLVLASFSSPVTLVLKILSFSRLQVIHLGNGAECHGMMDVSIWGRVHSAWDVIEIYF